MRKTLLTLLVLLPLTFAWSSTMDIYYGGSFAGANWNDVMVVSPGETVDIPVYVVSDNPDVSVADMMLPLGVNKAIVDQINAEACKVFYPLNEWDVASFVNPNDEYEQGKASLSFLGFAQIVSESSPFGHFQRPTKVMSFNVHLVDDPALIDNMVSALSAGVDPRQGEANMGDRLGNESFKVNEHFANFLFAPTAVDPEAPIPDDYFLADNYPNPFNPTTLFKYGLPEDAHVVVEIYDILGRKVQTLVDEDQTAGYHEVSYNGNRMASGMYFFRMQAGDFNQIKKMMLLK
jgi:hypothetical protein